MSHFTNNAINPQALTLMTNQANAQGQVAVKAVVIMVPVNLP